MIKVLQFWKSDGMPGGGAAILMHRLHSSLREAGIDSKILCEIKTTESSHVKVIRPWHRLESLIRRVTSRVGLNDIHRVSSFKIKQHQWLKEADILHFHATHCGFISYLALPFLITNKPTIFTLHDMWCLTGHCVHSFDCDRWKIGCGNCPYLDAYPPIRRDATHIEWKLKDWVYSRSNLTIVAPSTWLTQQAKQSMLKRFPIHRIPNGVDIQAYQPLDPEKCRSLLGIPPDKKVLMFASVNLENSLKGGDLLMKALQSLPASLKAEALLLLLGSRGERIAEAAGIPILNLGYVSNDRVKAIAYSAADLFVHPALADNFPLVLQESMACGTPMVSFKVGGVPDLVRPDITGYLAEPENAKDLCDGIVQLLEDELLRSHMSDQCRAIAVKEYPLELMVQRHIELYRRLLRN